MFQSIIQKLAEMLSQYGIWSAGLLSGHGAYEENVPSELIVLNEETE